MPPCAILILMTEILQDSAAPAHGQQVISACAFIHYDFEGVTKVFLPRRAETKKFLPGLLELPGGHIDIGEDIVDGLIREIREELEMTIRVGEPFAAFTYQNHVKGSQTVEVIYFAQFVEPIEQIVLHPHDHSEGKWFSEQQVRDNRHLLVPESQVTHAHSDDPEYLAIRRGFQILSGQALKAS